MGRNLRVPSRLVERLGPKDSPITLLIRYLGRDAIEDFLAGLDKLEALLVLYEWPLYARRPQTAPEGEWDTWIILGGRGMGKTRPGSETVITWARELGSRYGSGHIGLIAKDPGDARKVMIEGQGGGSAILECSPPWFRPRYEPSKKTLTWDNGVVATVYSSEDPDELRGPQHHKIWGDELCKWRHSEATWDNAAFGCRLGDNPQKLITTTPRPMKLLIDLLKEPTTKVTRGSMYDNSANLPAKFLKEIARKYEGTRLGRQEINAELLTDTPGALWNLKRIDELRVQKLPCPLTTLVVAIDPAGSSPGEGEVADDGIAETGIIAVGKGEDGHGYVVLDGSGQFTPADWGARAVAHAGTLRADYVVGETNNGGEMVEHVVKVAARDAGEDLYFKKVTASRGKRTRAEPVAALYEQGRMHHVGAFPELEDQMCHWVPGKKSPDRMDALVWGATEVMLLAPDELIFR